MSKLQRAWVSSVLHKETWAYSWSSPYDHTACIRLDHQAIQLNVPITKSLWRTFAFTYAPCLFFAIVPYALCTFTAPLQLYMCIIVLVGRKMHLIRQRNPEFTTLTDVVHAAAGASFLNSGSCAPVIMAKKWLRKRLQDDNVQVQQRWTICVL